MALDDLDLRAAGPASREEALRGQWECWNCTDSGQPSGTRNCHSLRDRCRKCGQPPRAELTANEMSRLRFLRWRLENR